MCGDYSTIMFLCQVNNKPGLLKKRLQHHAYGVLEIFTAVEFVFLQGLANVFFTLIDAEQS